MSEHDKHDTYRHLNDGGIPLKLDIDNLATQIVSMNYGFVRMLAALVRAVRVKQAEEQAYYDSKPQSYKYAKLEYPLTDLIDQAIVDGKISVTDKTHLFVIDDVWRVAISVLENMYDREILPSDEVRVTCHYCKVEYIDAILGFNHRHHCVAPIAVRLLKEWQIAVDAPKS